MNFSVFIDRNYLYPALVSLISATGSMPGSTLFHIGSFERELNQTDKDHLKTVFNSLGAQLQFLEVSKEALIDEIGEIDNKQHFGYSAFGRLALQRQIIEKHIYSDVDVLFHQDGLESIKQLTSSERIGFVGQSDAYALAGLPCAEQNEEFFSGFVYWPEIHRRPDLTFDSPQIWITPYSTHDQALLNMKIGQQFDRLDPIFCQLDNPLLDASAYKPGILHYFGNWKPWQAVGKARSRCHSKNCSWTLWFTAEEEAKRLLNSIGLGPWFRELRRVSLQGAPKNLKLLRRVLCAGRMTGTIFVIAWLIRFLWKDEKHLIH